MLTLIYKKELPNKKETVFQACTFEDTNALRITPLGKKIRFYKGLVTYLHDDPETAKLCSYPRVETPISQEQFETLAVPEKAFSFTTPCNKRLSEVEQANQDLREEVRIKGNKIIELEKEILVLRNNLLEVEKELRESEDL